MEAGGQVVVVCTRVQVRSGEVAMPGEEEVAEMYLRGVELLEGRGLLRCGRQGEPVTSAGTR